MPLEQVPITLIEDRFDLNIERVKSLISVYNNISSESLSDSQRNDVLRSAVVFIHAALEDLLRELTRWKAPIENDNFVSKLQFQVDPESSKLKTSVTIAELIKLRSSSVDEIIATSISNHLVRRSYNDPTEITQAINLLGIQTAAFEAFLAPIAECVERRHNIVHRGDRSDYSADSHGRPKKITPGAVMTWNSAVERLGDVLFEHLRPPEAAVPAEPSPKMKRQQTKVVRRKPRA